MKGWRQKSWRGWEGRLQCTGTHGWLTLWKADGENDGKEEKQGWHIDGVRKGASSNYDDPLKRKSRLLSRLLFLNLSANKIRFSEREKNTYLKLLQHGRITNSLYFQHFFVLQIVTWQFLVICPHFFYLSTVFITCPHFLLPVHSWHNRHRHLPHCLLDLGILIQTSWMWCPYMGELFVLTDIT